MILAAARIMACEAILHKTSLVSGRVKLFR